MSDDIYKSPESDVSVTSNKIAPLPNSFFVAIFIVVVSLLLDIIVEVIDNYLGIPFSVSAVIPALVSALAFFLVGIYYGNKRKAFFTIKFRIKVIAIWLVLSAMIPVYAFYSIDPDILNPINWDANVIGFFFGVLLVRSLICYFTLYFGEKLGVTLARKPS